MSERASQVQAAELSLGIARRGVPRAAAGIDRGDSMGWAVWLVVLTALVMRLLLVWLGPVGDPARAIGSGSPPYLEAAAAFDAEGAFAAVPGEAGALVERQPAYAGLLAVVHGLGLPVVTVLLLQVALGCAAVYLTYLLGAILLGSPTGGLIAAAVVAVHPAGWLAASTLLPESLGIALLLFGLWLAAERRRRDYGSAVLGGLTIGAATLCLPLTGLLGAIIAGWIACHDRRWRGAVFAVLFGAASLVPVGGWQARNVAGGGSAIEVSSLIMPAAFGDLIGGERLLMALTGHGGDATWERLGLSAPEELRDASALALVTGGAMSPSAAPSIAWGVCAAAVAVGAGLGGVSLLLRRRRAGLALPGALLVAIWMTPATDAWRWQAVAAIPMALLLAGVAAEGRIVWRWRRRERAEMGDSDDDIAARVGRPL